MNPFEVLGLEEDERDPQIIRRGYARKLREHRPDDDPEGFQRVRQAYEWLKSGYHAFESGDFAFAIEAGDDEDDREVEETPSSDVPLRETAPRVALEPFEPAPSVRAEISAPLTGRRTSLPDLSPHAIALDHYFAESPDPLRELVSDLRESGNVGALLELAREAERRSAGGLPREGAETVILLATSIAVLNARIAHVLANRAFEALPIHSRYPEMLDALDHSVAAVKELKGLQQPGRVALAKIMARSEWDGKRDVGFKEVVRAARRAPPKGAFYAWVIEVAPDLERFLKLKGEAEEKTRSGGGFLKWFLIAVAISAVIRNCGRSSDVGVIPALRDGDGRWRNEHIERILREYKERRERRKPPSEPHEPSKEPETERPR